jgi:hypothetical protein
VLVARRQQSASLFVIQYHTYILDTFFAVVLSSQHPLVVSMTFKICLVNISCEIRIHLPDDMVITVIWLDKNLVESYYLDNLVCQYNFVVSIASFVLIITATTLFDMSTSW